MDEQAKEDNSEKVIETKPNQPEDQTQVAPDQTEQVTEPTQQEQKDESEDTPVLDEGMESLLNKYSRRANAFWSYMTSQEEFQENKAFVKDYRKAKLGLLALEQIEQVIHQGKSVKRGAPDGSQDISMIEKMTAKLVGWLGLSDTGLSTETHQKYLSQEDRTELLLHSVQRRKLALEKVLSKFESESDESISVEKYEDTLEKASKIGYEKSQDSQDA